MIVPPSKKYYPIILALLLLFIGRVFLLGKGHLDDTDELPFLFVLKEYDHLIRLHVDSWNLLVFTWWSTYLETAIRLVEAFFLRQYAGIRGLPVSSTEALELMGFFNILTSLLISYVFYKILLRVGFSTIIAAAGILIYGTLLNSNIYVRHILPYDASLLFYLIAIYILLANNLKVKQVCIAGIFCSLGHFTYYGNFMLLFIAWGMLIMNIEMKPGKLILHTIILASPSIILLLLLESIAQMSGQSYIMFIIKFSKTIYHGSPQEGLVYVFKYFYSVEKWWGILILFLFFIGLVYSVINPQKVPRKRLQLLFIGILAYLIYGSYAVLTGNMVFYGRVLHMYYPFIIIGVLFIAERFRNAALALSLIACIHYVFVIKDLNSIGYPRTMIYQYNLFDKGEQLSFEWELKYGIIYNYKIPLFYGQGFDIPTIYLEKPDQLQSFKHKLILLNFCFFYHYPNNFINNHKIYTPPKNSKELVDKKHFMSYPAYTFEYCTKEGREFFKKNAIRIKIFRVSDK